MVLPIVGLYIETISSGNSIVLQFGLTNKAQLYFLIFTLSKNQAAVRAEEYKITTIGNTCSLVRMLLTQLL